MGDLKRQAPACAIVAALGSHYEDAAKRLCGSTASDRRSSSSADIKFMNNFVKACVLDVAVGAVAEKNLHVLDIACGRGQDAAKWRHACLAHGARIGKFYGVDLIDPGPARALASRFLGADVCTDVDIRLGDAAAGGLRHIPDASVHIVSCQLALHYFFETEDKFGRLMATVGRVLDPGGIFLASFTEGRAVVRRCRRALTCLPRADVDVTHATSVLSIKINSLHVRPKIPSIWGCEYIFSLTDSIDTCPEFLCHEGVVHQVAKQCGIGHGAFSQSFDACIRQWKHVDKFHAIGALMNCWPYDTPQARDAASLYRLVVLCKSQDACCAFTAGMTPTTGATSATRSLSSQTRP